MSRTETKIRASEPYGDGVMYVCRDDLVASFRAQAETPECSGTLAIALRFFADYLAGLEPEGLSDAQ